jgi:hypothetical protein
MKMDVDPFLINTIEFEEKRVLVRTDKAETTKGKNVVVSDELRNRMTRPRNLEIGVWKENTQRRVVCRVKPMSSMLIGKYLRQQQERGHKTLSGFKRERSPGYHHRSTRWGARIAWECPGPAQTWDRAVPRSVSWARCSLDAKARDDVVPWDQRTRLAEQSSDVIILCGGTKSQHERQEQVEEDIIMVGIVPCKLLSKIHIDGRRVTMTARPDRETIRPKCTRIMTTEGREVVGLGYPTSWDVVEQGVVKGRRWVPKNEKTPTLDTWGTVIGKRDPWDNDMQVKKGETWGLYSSTNPETVTADSTTTIIERKMSSPHWCPMGLSKMQRRRLQKMLQKEIAERQREEEHDQWFN